MAELLIEVGCEELPSSACREILEQAPALVERALDGLRLEHGSVRVWVAPRRFAIYVTRLAEAQEAASRSVRGPARQAAFDADDVPTKAAKGFARGQKIAVEDLVVREDGGREFVYAEVSDEARETAGLVPQVAATLVDGLRFGKTMRWGAGGPPRFSRPIRWLVAKLGQQTIPFELHGLTAGETSRGHRFLGSDAVISSARAYRDALREQAVVADHEERRETIVAGLDAAATQLGCTWGDPGGKLAEVLFLVERPSVIVGAIAAEHMRLPPRILVTAMQSHQRYMPLSEPDGQLHPGFLAVSNGDPAHADTIVRGNEEVLDARLQDAAFSFDRDREAGLAALDARLDSIVFHQRLGSMAAKRERLIGGVAEIAAYAGVDAQEAEDAGAAARLAQADQGAVLVAEFSELQGYVGAQYARIEGHPEAVARALEEQYLPEGPDSPSPASVPGALLALAEKVDNLVGAFAVDEAPTGSRDPYGLRRAAAGLVRVLLERGWELPLRDLLWIWLSRLREQGADVVPDEGPVLDALEAFVGDRLAAALAAEGVAAESTAAAAGARVGGPLATADWARAIDQARGKVAFESAWTACTRCAKLAAKAPEGVDGYLSVGDAGEDTLAEALEQARAGVTDARERRDFADALAAAGPLAGAVDRFFQDVLVNAEDPDARRRRYALVRGAAQTLGQVADFTRIGGGGGRG